MKRKKTKIARQELSKDKYGGPGYMRVRLCKEGRHWKPSVHQVVAMTFIGMQEKGMTVNHKDGNKLNNHVSNLEYISRSENQIHAYRLGLQKPQRGEDRPMSKLRSTDIVEIRLSTSRASELSEKFNVSESLIYMIRSKKRWGHII